MIGESGWSLIEIGHIPPTVLIPTPQTAGFFRHARDRGWRSSVRSGVCEVWERDLFVPQNQHGIQFCRSPQRSDASRKIATCRLRQRRPPRSSARKAFTNFSFFATDFPTQHRSAALANHRARQDNTLVFSEVGHQPVSRACQDLAGNTASATVSGINTDKLRPLSLLLALLRTPTAGTTQTLP